MAILIGFEQDPKNCKHYYDQASSFLETMEQAYESEKPDATDGQGATDGKDNAQTVLKPDNTKVVEKITEKDSLFTMFCKYASFIGQNSKTGSIAINKFKLLASSKMNVQFFTDLANQFLSEGFFGAETEGILSFFIICNVKSIRGVFDNFNKNNTVTSLNELSSAAVKLLRETKVTDPFNPLIECLTFGFRFTTDLPIISFLQTGIGIDINKLHSSIVLRAGIFNKIFLEFMAPMEVVFPVSESFSLDKISIFMNRVLEQGLCRLIVKI